MARIPVVGSDEDQFGAVLNEFLLVANNMDGTLKDAAVAATATVSGHTTAIARLDVAFDVASFDAVGDFDPDTGIGTDNTPFFQAAFDAAAAARAGGAGKVKVTVSKPGLYLFEPLAGFGASSHKFFVKIMTGDLDFVWGPGTGPAVRTGHANGGILFNVGKRDPMDPDWQDYQFGKTANVATYPVYAINPIPAKGARTATLVTPADATNLTPGKAVLLRTGQVLAIQSTAGEPDAEVNEVVDANPTTGVVTFKNQTLKPYVQEYYPAAPGPGIGPTTTAVTAWPELFGIQDIESEVIRNVRILGGHWDLKVSTGWVAGVSFGACLGYELSGYTADCEQATVHYGGVFRDFLIDGKQHSKDTITRMPFFGTAWGCGDGVIRGRFTAEGAPQIGHLHEGSASIVLDRITLHNPPNSGPNHGIQCLARHYDITVIEPDIIHETNSGVPLYFSGDGFRPTVIKPRRLKGNFEGISNGAIDTLIDWDGFASNNAAVRSVPTYLAVSFTYADSGFFTIGQIPPRVEVIAAEAYVQQTFSGGGSPKTVALGISGSGSHFFPAVSIAGAAGPAPVARSVGSGYYQGGSTAKDIVVSMSPNGATAGRVVVVLGWIHVKYLAGT